MALLKFPDKDPRDKLDYTFRFASEDDDKHWLNDGDFIVEATVDARHPGDNDNTNPVANVVVQGAVISVDQEADFDGPSQVSAIVSGGDANTVIALTATIKTNAGLEAQRSGLLRVVQR